MHPPRFKNARSLHALAAVLLLVGGGVWGAGCQSASDRPVPAFAPTDTIEATVRRDSALSVLSSMQRTAFDSAYAALDTYTVTRYVRTEQLDSTGTITARRAHVIQYAPGTERGTIQQSDSAGTFRGGGLLGRVAPDRRPTDRPANVAEQILPDQPAYIEPRTREAFRYALRADTLLDDQPVYALEARARDDGTGRDQSIRHARLLITRGSRELIGLTTVRADPGLLFSEHSRLHLRLRPLHDTWVPDVARVRAVLNVPFRAPRQFRTVSAFYHYRR